MTWIAWLTFAVVITAIAAVTGIQPKGARPVARTQMMGVARFVLLALAAVFAFLAFQAR